jgi:hypothetical protein
LEETFELDFYQRCIILRSLQTSLKASRELLDYLLANRERAGQFGIENQCYRIEQTELAIKTLAKGSDTLEGNLSDYLYGLPTLA